MITMKDLEELLTPKDLEMLKIYISSRSKPPFNIKANLMYEIAYDCLIKGYGIRKTINCLDSLLKLWEVDPESIKFVISLGLIPEMLEVCKIAQKGRK
jgi:hypothetical protein